MLNQEAIHLVYQTKGVSGFNPRSPKRNHSNCHKTLRMHKDMLTINVVAEKEPEGNRKGCGRTGIRSRESAKGMCVEEEGRRCYGWVKITPLMSGRVFGMGGDGDLVHYEQYHSSSNTFGRWRHICIKLMY